MHPKGFQDIKYSISEARKRDAELQSDEVKPASESQTLGKLMMEGHWDLPRFLPARGKEKTRYHPDEDHQEGWTIAPSVIEADLEKKYRRIIDRCNEEIEPRSKNFEKKVESAQPLRPAEEIFACFYDGSRWRGLDIGAMSCCRDFYGTWRQVNRRENCLEGGYRKHYPGKRVPLEEERALVAECKKALNLK